MRIYTPRHLRRIKKIVFEILYEITKYILFYFTRVFIVFWEGGVRIFLAECVIWREYCGGRGVLHTCAFLSSTSLVHFDLLSYYPTNRLLLTSWREDFGIRGVFAYVSISGKEHTMGALDLLSRSPTNQVMIWPPLPRL